jgi:hypothetical protein
LGDIAEFHDLGKQNRPFCHPAGWSHCLVFAMVHHVVLFRFRTDLAAGAVETIFQELRGLRQRIPGITGFQGGMYNSPEGLAKGFTHGFTMTFVDAAARDAYLPHPLHQAVVDRLLPMLDGGIDAVVAFDFIDGVMAPGF